MFCGCREKGKLQIEDCRLQIENATEILGKKFPCLRLGVRRIRRERCSENRGRLVDKKYGLPLECGAFPPLSFGSQKESGGKAPQSKKANPLFMIYGSAVGT
jgi:hypothetical protein